MNTKQPEALQIIQGWEAIHAIETSEIEQLAWESCTELQRLHDANTELKGNLKHVLTWIKHWKPDFINNVGWLSALERAESAICTTLYKND